MSFAEEYQQKLTTAQEAAAAVRSGDWVDYGCASPHRRRSTRRLPPAPGNWRT